MEALKLILDHPFEIIVIAFAIAWIISAIRGE